VIEWSETPEPSCRTYESVSGFRFLLRTLPDGRFELQAGPGHTPRWVRDSLEEAQAIVLDHERQFQALPDAAADYWPCFRVDGDEMQPLTPQPELSGPVPACPSCGSDARPVLRKPLRYTFDWWDYERGGLFCPDCGALRPVDEDDVWFSP
jgi:hypothetical protein